MCFCLNSQDEPHTTPGQTLVLCHQLRWVELLLDRFKQICVKALLEGHRRALPNLQPLMISREGKKYWSQTIDTAMSM